MESIKGKKSRAFIKKEQEINFQKIINLGLFKVLYEIYLKFSKIQRFKCWSVTLIVRSFKCHSKNCLLCNIIFILSLG